MTKHTILFMAANPIETPGAQLDREASAIQAELERSTHRSSFEFMTRWATTPLDLLRELRRLRPSVIHFSGHGVGAGLYFQDEQGHAKLVAADALRAALGAVDVPIKVVVLNACYSAPQAEALREHADCVVGMSGQIRDTSARTFAIGFYGALGDRASVASAHQQGCAAISLVGLADQDQPQLVSRDGVDPRHLVLAADPR